MKTLVVFATILVVARVAAAGAPVVLRESEAPRATDLLRAEKLAEQAEKRRTLPPTRHRAEWKRGGNGWDHHAARAEPSDSVVINLGSSPPAKRRPDR
jgi:hypothetical protein